MPFGEADISGVLGQLNFLSEVKARNAALKYNEQVRQQQARANQAVQLGTLAGAAIGTVIEPGGGTMIGAGLGSMAGKMLGPRATDSPIGVPAIESGTKLMQQQMAKDEQNTANQKFLQAFKQLFAPPGTTPTASGPGTTPTASGPPPQKQFSLTDSNAGNEQDLSGLKDLLGGASMGAGSMGTDNLMESY